MKPATKRRRVRRNRRFVDGSAAPVGGLVIAIDGPAGSGKSSTAKMLAKRMKLPFIDTGAMYRAITLKAMRAGIELADTSHLVAVAKRARIRLSHGDPAKQQVYLDGKNVTKAIREPELTKNVFYVAQEPLIRREMVKKQRAMGQKGGAVMEGRDIGTKVFPDADYKFFFVASKAVRALRRQRELAASGKRTTVAQVRRDLVRRDKTDTKRKEGPLRQAKDAIRVDTSALTIEATVDKILRIVSANPLKRSGLAARR